jgi:hypothetical protein
MRVNFLLEFMYVKLFMCGVVIHLCTHCGWCLMFLPVVFLVACLVP